MQGESAKNLRQGCQPRSCSSSPLLQPALPCPSLWPRARASGLGWGDPSAPVPSHHVPHADGGGGLQPGPSLGAWSSHLRLTAGMTSWR